MTLKVGQEQETPMLAKVTHVSEHASNWDTAKIHRVLGEENLNNIEFVLEDGSFTLCCWCRIGFVSMPAEGWQKGTEMLERWPILTNSASSLAVDAALASFFSGSLLNASLSNDVSS